MHRRDFMQTSLGAVLAAAVRQLEAADAGVASPLASPRATKLAVRPVMTDIVHTGV